VSTKDVARRSATDGAQEASRNELLCQGPRGRWQVGRGWTWRTSVGTVSTLRQLQEATPLTIRLQ